MSSVCALLASTHLNDIRPRAGRDERSLLVLYHNDTVRDALKALARRGVLSAPVVVDEFVMQGPGTMEGVMDDADDEVGKKCNSVHRNGL